MSKLKYGESDLLGRVCCSQKLKAELKIVQPLDYGPVVFNKFM